MWNVATQVVFSKSDTDGAPLCKNPLLPNTVYACTGVGVPEQRGYIIVQPISSLLEIQH